MEFIYPLKSEIITKDSIKINLQLFWNKIIKSENLTEDKFFAIQFKVKLGNGIFRYISKIQKLDRKDLNLLS